MAHCEIWENGCLMQQGSSYVLMGFTFPSPPVVEHRDADAEKELGRLNEAL